MIIIKRLLLSINYLQNVFNKPINLVLLNPTFLYSLKTSENLAVFWCFQGVEKGQIGNEWFKL